MAYQMTVSPDFTPDHISGWYIFNTSLQRSLDISVHLELLDSFEDQRAAMEHGLDIIFANPYNAAELVRERVFLTIVRTTGKADEALVVVKDEYLAQCVEDPEPGVRIASTGDPDVRLMCAMMLEPAELNDSNTESIEKAGYPVVAKALIEGEVELGFFLAEEYESLSKLTKESLRPLVQNEIQVIHHALLLGPDIHHLRDPLGAALQDMGKDEKGKGVLSALGFQGWTRMEHEEIEFMIDLMDTLAAPTVTPNAP